MIICDNFITINYFETGIYKSGIYIFIIALSKIGTQK